jgi:hypothetical protein
MVCDGGEGVAETLPSAATAAGIAEAAARIAPDAISKRTRAAGTNLAGGLNLLAARECRSERTGIFANISMIETVRVLLERRNDSFGNRQFFFSRKLIDDKFQPANSIYQQK